MIYLVYNAVFIPICHVEAVQDDISSKTMFDYGCITLYYEMEMASIGFMASTVLSKEKPFLSDCLEYLVAGDICIQCDHFNSL